MSKAKTKKSHGKSKKAAIRELAAKPAQKPIPPLEFSYGASLVHKSIRLLRSNFESSVIIFALPSLLMTLGILLSGDGRHASSSTGFGYLLTAIGFIWFIISMFAVYPFSVGVARGLQPGVIASYRRGFYFAPRLIGLTLLLFPLIVLAACLLIIPGLIVIRRYCLAFYYIVDQDVGIREAMALSASQTKPVSSAVYGMIGVFLLFLIIANGFSRTISPYGTIFALVVEILYLFAPALLYLEIQHRNPDSAQPDPQSTLAVEN